MSGRRRCRKCLKCLITGRNWTKSLKSKNDKICLKCNRNKHNKLYLEQRENRIKKSKEQYKKDYKNKTYKYGSFKWATMKLASHRYIDKKRNHKICDFKTDEFLSFIKKPCKYCKDSKDKITLDRVDCNKGHTKNNVVPCCSLCNTAGMASFTYEEYLIIGKAIAKIKQRRL